jgi:CYTH domain-containing protein
MEIERKWLIEEKNLPENFKANYPGHRINQGYVNPDDEYLIRVRHNKSIRHPEKEKDTYKLEIKSKGLFVRDEWRYDTTKENFWEIYKKCSRTISKTRYYMMVDHLQYEIDFYDAHDFITLEIEFDSLEEAENFEVPSWFGEDVTYKPEYKNVNLAQ